MRSDNEHSRRLREQLVGALVEGGALRSPLWRRAFERVGREVFVPRFWRETGAGWELVDSDRPSSARSGCRRSTGTRCSSSVRTMATTRSGAAPRRCPRSWPRCSRLAVRDGDRVLEIGTGSGDNAALLCERLGSDRVTSVDCDAELVETARHRLSDHGYEPIVAAGDDFFGHAPKAPYDRMIATCTVRQVPRAWIAQTRPGGRPFAFMRMQGHWRQPPPAAELLTTGTWSPTSGTPPGRCTTTTGRR